MLASFERTSFSETFGQAVTIKKGRICCLPFAVQPNKMEIAESEVWDKYDHVRLVFSPNSKLMKKYYTLLEPTVINSRTTFPL